MNWYFFLITIFTCFEKQVYSEKTCKVIDHCSCKMNTGEIISLHDIDGRNKVRFHDIRTYSSGSFFYNPCTPFNRGDPTRGCVDTLFCQQLFGQYISLADPKTFSTTVEDGKVLFNYNMDGRQTKIKLECDHENSDPSMSPIQQEQYEQKFSFTLKTKCACPNGCAHRKKKNLSTGSVLCILLLVFVLIYLIGGGAFLKYHRQEKGTDIIPNYSFWAEIPGLVKDGCLFTRDKLKRGSNEYQEI